MKLMPLYRLILDSLLLGCVTAGTWARPPRIELGQSGAVVLFLVMLAGCASAPLEYPKEESFAIADTSQTREAQESREWFGGRDDVNGFLSANPGLRCFRRTAEAYRFGRGKYRCPVLFDEA